MFDEFIKSLWWIVGIEDPCQLYKTSPWVNNHKMQAAVMLLFILLHQDLYVIYIYFREIPGFEATGQDLDDDQLFLMFGCKFFEKQILFFIFIICQFLLDTRLVLYFKWISFRILQVHNFAKRISFQQFLKVVDVTGHACSHCFTFDVEGWNWAKRLWMVWVWRNVFKYILPLAWAQI